ncbi:MAG: 30S ribosomal protein S8 [Planctomycetota bacterium]|jgi:small subunit ribosomal protein S8|nr:30S ribosomal protein S8 [Planctomycetota bacterium]
MMTDPIADMLTRIRNALAIYRATVDVPASKIKLGVTEVLKREGYIEDFKIIEEQPQNRIRLYLKYGPDGEMIIQKLDRVSRPGMRQYKSTREVVPVLDGLGTGIYSTPRGILTDRECVKEKVGGEYLCRLW